MSEVFYRCCDHCLVDDPDYHRDNPPDSHTTTCSVYPTARPCTSGGDRRVVSVPGGEEPSE